MAEQGLCPTCGESFLLKPKSKIYCKPDCRPSRQKSIRYSKKQTLGNAISTGNIGSLSELLVCADLVRKGFFVLRSVCPHGPFDVIACKLQDILRIEIRTGRKSAYGKLHFPQLTEKQKIYVDILAVVLIEENEIFYFKNGCNGLEHIALEKTVYG